MIYSIIWSSCIDYVTIDSSFELKGNGEMAEWSKAAASKAVIP